MIIDADDHELMHYGILRRSGRYPWGSGSTENKRNRDFLDYLHGMRDQGLTDTQIAQGIGVSLTALRAANTIAKNQQIMAQIGAAERYKAKGMSNVAIGEKMGLNESTVRSRLAPGAREKADILTAISRKMQEKVDKGLFLDVGLGVENTIGISKDKLNAAVAILREQGYELHKIQVPQPSGKMTTVKVICPPKTTYRDVVTQLDKITLLEAFSEDGGRTLLGIKPPLNISSKRLAINYKEDGGDQADGVIYVRPGVDDVSLGGARYAQVRIAIDGTHFIKGMAMYKDDLPPGVDLVFNTVKERGGTKLDALKPMKDDADNPFGASISRQIFKRDEAGNDIVTSAMNLVNEQGDWEKWSKTLSSQVLSKQRPKLAKTQLAMTLDNKRRELAEIESLTNPAIKRKLLQSFSDDVDSSAVHLKAAHLPGQGSHVILPINSMKDTEIYAPNYENGDRVVLIRYPHGGLFEIPELTVNNRQREAKSLLGQAPDAVGINSEVAKRLSGADFDGDTVLVIPNHHGNIKTQPALEGLKDFDARLAYPAHPDAPRMSPDKKQTEMGVVSNLITDMTIGGANPSELAAAVRHSMAVIDAEKHPIDWKESARVNGISHLKEKYQGGAKAGAATLISRAGSRVDVPKRTPRSMAKGGPIDPKTGRLEYDVVAKTWTTPTGKIRTETQVSKKLAETDDAFTLVGKGNTVIENVYATHSNEMKALANSARRTLVQIKPTPYSRSANLAYKEQVASLDAKLDAALKNKPLERQALLISNTVIAAKKAANPDMDRAQRKKMEAQALEAARIRTGATRQQIEFTDDEWSAIQAGAITNHKLTQMLDNANVDQVKQLATPRTNLVMTSAKMRRAETMLASGYSQAEVAAALGVPVSTLKSSVMRKEEG